MDEADCGKDTASAPMYLHIRRDLLRKIDNGTYHMGDMLPSESDIAQQYGVTRLTARRAIDGLVDEGYIVRAQGKGTYVNSSLFAQEEVPLGFRASHREDGHKASVRILRAGLRPAGPYYARLFGIGTDDEVYNIRRLNMLDGSPESLEEIYIPVPVFPEIPGLDVSIFSLYEAYAIYGHPVAKSIEYLDVAEVNARDAQLLHLNAGDLVLLNDCMSYDTDGRLIERAVMTQDGKKGAFSIYD